MVLKEITLLNFRNYKKQTLEFSENINILIGNNAQGKTNILEAIYVLAITKSHRSSIDNNLIKDNEEFCKLKGKIIINDISKNLEFFLSNTEKKVQINKTKIKKLTEYISSFNIIIFTPDDLELIKGSPINRRKFLNVEIGQIDNNYLNVLNDYNRILKTRNEYLKKVPSKKKLNENYFEIITKKLIDCAIIIYKKREEFINLLNIEINKIYKDIMNNGDLNIKYINNLNCDIKNELLLEEFLYNKYKNNLSKEILLGLTLFGPHKDDIVFKVNDQDIKSYGSQGQQRSCILSLKLSEINVFKKITKNVPIVLLDDVFSEFDNSKKNNIIKYIKKDIQVVITTTDLNKINKELISDSYIYKVENGKIERQKV